MSLFTRCTLLRHSHTTFPIRSQTANSFRNFRIDSSRTVAITSEYPHILLRAEEKPLEHRSFSPAVIKTLVDAGYPISVERSPTDPKFKRIFEDSEYEAAGARLVDTGAKELPEEEFPLKNDHITFAHCFKSQGGWEKVLGRWSRGGSTLYDLEFLHDAEGRRVSALNGQVLMTSSEVRLPRSVVVAILASKTQKELGMHDASGGARSLSFMKESSSTGRSAASSGDLDLNLISVYAGFAGAALGIKTLSHQLQDSSSKLPSVETFTDGRGYYLNEDELVNQIREDLAKAEKALGRKPTALVLGALGRCGKGAVDLFLKAGMPDENISRWDLNETKDRDGPYEEIAKADVFLNAIYLSKPIPPFINQELLAKKGRNLAVVIDDPTVPVEIKDDQNNLPLSVISIDHLPSILPREASEAFSEGLKESLLTLKDRKTSRVWADAEKLFHEEVATLPEELRTKSV
ncbi:ubiquitin thiolesterase [Fusarium mundagurra]|uniref:Ubiquitin thiolesterase n=1 Tax=Fusarium mundagurra TaxID=1567541 RepID=A0A8H6DGI2_9HYPO|nr:ubiquitin thiolesterase [Fusarium mundagurra]